MHRSLSMFELPIAVLFLVIVIWEGWLIATIRETIAIGRSRKGFRHRRLSRQALIGFLVVAVVFLAVIGCFLIVAMIRLW